jgi:hypothetical protein
MTESIQVLQAAWGIAYKEIGKQGGDKVPTIDMITGGWWLCLVHTCGSWLAAGQHALNAAVPSSLQATKSPASPHPHPPTPTNARTGAYSVFSEGIGRHNEGQRVAAAAAAEAASKKKGVMGSLGIGGGAGKSKGLFSGNKSSGGGAAAAGVPVPLAAAAGTSSFGESLRLLRRLSKNWQLCCGMAPHHSLTLLHFRSPFVKHTRREPIPGASVLARGERRRARRHGVTHRRLRWLVPRV